MKLHILILILITLLASCKEDKKKDIAKLVTEWQGKEIIFPQKNIFTRYTTDTIDFTIPQSDYKVLIYIDSIGCTSCKLQLHKWEEMIDFVDSVCDKKIPFLFFFHPKDSKEIRYILKRESFDRPVCIDLEDQLNKLNQFPADMTFQTFLLDKNNKIKVIGNPIHNLAVKDLYLKQLTGGNNPTNKLLKTNAKAEPSEIDLGTFNKSEIKEATFELKNTGNNPLVIVDVSTTCGCTTASYDKEPAKPGGILRVGIKMTPKDTGFFDETVTVKCNTEQFVKLRIRGSVR